MKSTTFVLASVFLFSPALSHGSQPGPHDQLLARAERGEVQQVLEEIDTRLRDDENRQLRFLKARLLAESGQRAQAMAVYRELIERYPDLPEPYNNLAALLAAQGELKQAQQILEQAMRTHPSYAAIYENLSVVFVELARDSYGKALRINHRGDTVAMQQLAALSGVAHTAQAEAIEVASNEAPRETPAAETPTEPVTAEAAPPARDKPLEVASTAAPGSLVPEAPAQTEPRQLAKATLPTTYPAPGPAVIEKDLFTTLQAWADAWSDRHVDRYLDYYTADYRPPDMSRPAWQQQRRQRLSKPEWIEVKLSDFELAEINGDAATVTLIQRYRSNTYRDVTRKRFELQRKGGSWRIAEETTLEQLP